MSKIKKYVLYPVLACFLAGALLAVIGYSLGGNPAAFRIMPAFIRNHAAASPSGTAETVIPDAADVRSLDVDIDGARVYIRSGEECSLNITGDLPIDSRMEAGIWKITNASDWDVEKINTRIVEITVPRDTVFDAVDLTIGAGELNADSLHFSEGEFEIGAGSMELTNCTGFGKTEFKIGAGTLDLDDSALEGLVKIDCGLGEANLWLEEPEYYGYSVDGGLAAVEIGDDFTASLAIGQKKNPDANVFYEIDCGMGSVRIRFIR